MVAKRSPEWLPDGWAAQFRLQKRGRKIEFYTNLETGKNFFSKDDVIRYIKMSSTHGEKPQPTTVHIQNHSEEIHSRFVGDPTEYPEWLPKGWKVELRIRKTGVHVGKEYKCYIDPSTAYTFYSKPEVFRYLETIKRKSCKSKKLEAVSLKRCITKKKVVTPVQVDVEREDVEDLPPGWIKETKVRKYANRLRRDPYYIDPVSGYVFRSKKDVYHYLETGEISRYAFKPKNMCTDDLEVADDEIAPSSATKRQKIESVTRQLHFGGKGNSEMSSLEIPETETSQLQDKEVSAETGFAYASTADVVGGKHLTENKVEEFAKTEGDCSPSRSAQPEAELSDRHEGNRSWLEVEGSVIDPSNIREAQIDSSKSKNKGKLNLPRRCSKRLAGVAPERHLTENKVEDCAKTKGDCSPNRSTQPKPEPSDRHEGKRSLCKVEGSVVHPGFAGNEPVSTPAAGTLNENSPKTMMEKNVREAQIDSSQLKNEGKLKLPRRSSKRLAGVPPEKHLIDNVVENGAKTKVGCSPKRSTQPKAELSDRHEGKRSLLEVEGSVIDPGNMNCSANEPVSTPAVDTLNETVTGKSDVRKAHIDSRKLNKGNVNLPRRSSKRLAGVEPEQVAHSVSSEGALQSATGKSSKIDASQGAGLASDQFVNKASQQLGAASATEVAHHILTDRNSASHKEPLNKGKMPVDEQFVPIEQQQILETEKIDTEKQEPQLSFLFGSDPCLEFAFKTLTGELPISSTVDKGPILKSAPKTENSLESGMENSCSKNPRANKSMTNKELKLSHRSLKQFAGVESERLANTISSEQALRNAPGKSYTSKKAIPAVDSENEVSRHLEVDPEKKLANHPCTTTTNTARQEELSDKSKKSLEEQAVPQEKPQKFESEKVEVQNPEPQFPFPFMDSWSDPCLDFAFKTLTGAIPIEDDLLHGYFQEKLDTSHNHRDGLALPDFGPASFFQNDISPQFDEPEQSVSGQQLPMNSSFCSSGNMSMSNCNGVGSSQQLSMNPSFFQPGNASLSNSSGTGSSQQQSTMNFPFPHAGNVSMSNCSGFGSVQQVPLNSPFLPAANVSMSNFRGYGSVQQLPTNSPFLPAGHVSMSNCSGIGVGSGQQLTTNNSPFLPAGNVSLSNCSAVGLPTPCLGGTKDSHGKVKS